MPALSFTPENMYKVLSMQKTETSRPVREDERGYFSGVADGRYVCPAQFSAGTCEWLMSFDAFKRVVVRSSVYQKTGLTRFECGRDYAIVPGRGKSAVGRVTVWGLYYQRLKDTTGIAACNEGFNNPEEFIQLYQSLYRKGPDFNPVRLAIVFKLMQVNERGLDWLVDYAESCLKNSDSGVIAPFGVNPISKPTWRTRFERQEIEIVNSNIEEA